MELVRPRFIELSALTVEDSLRQDQTGLCIGVAASPPAGTPSQPALDRFAFTLATFPTNDPRCVHVDDLGLSLDEAMTAVEKNVLANPIAAGTAVDVLSINSCLEPTQGLLVESLAYSTLQGGSEFRAWLSSRPTKPMGPPDAEPVNLNRTDDLLGIVLNRPAKHNALDRAMRDDLLAALAIVSSSPDLRLELSGNGPSFCSGGDLEEFGLFSDPASAHVVRMTLSIGARLMHLSDRSTAYVHGFTAGSGLELAAFCGRVVAARDTRCFMPELHLGLIPGAGGTVSISRRIGRWRTAALLLSAAQISAGTALEWGLVDAIA